jgi:hypothetical protein
MNSFDDWYSYADSLSKCLIALDSRFACTIFPILTEGVKLENSSSKWYRVLNGYMHIDPTENGRNFYQHDMPSGLEFSEIGEYVISQNNTLMQELDNLINKTKLAAKGEPVNMRSREGKSIIFCATGDDLEILKNLKDGLIHTRNACQANYNSDIVGEMQKSRLQKYFNLIETNDGQPQVIVDLVLTSAAYINNLRWRYAADVRLTALFYIQSRLCELILEQYRNGQLTNIETTSLVAKVMESSSSEHDPDRMLIQFVIDFSRARQNQLILKLYEESLSSAKSSIRSAKDSTELGTHSGHLFSSVLFAYAAMRLAEVFCEYIPTNTRPSKATDDYLKRCASTAEEETVRAAHALVVGCINRGSGQMLENHFEQVRSAYQIRGLEGAQAKVSTLIDDFYFYPRYYSEEFMKEYK